MSKKSYVRGQDGEVTHIRITSDDGRRSWLYEVDNSVLGQLFYGERGRCVEVADHHPDGITTAYEKDNSVIGEPQGAGPGEQGRFSAGRVFVVFGGRF